MLCLELILTGHSSRKLTNITHKAQTHRKICVIVIEKEVRWQTHSPGPCVPTWQSPFVMHYVASQVVVFKNGASSKLEYQDADTKLREGMTVRAIARDRCLMELRSREKLQSSALMANLDCQLEGFWNLLRDMLLSISGRAFSERIN